MLSELTIVSSARNERENVDLFVELVRELRIHFAYPIKVVIVDNGSSDGTYQKLSEISNSLMGFRAVRNETPGGYGDGIGLALSLCQTKYALIVPSDLQYRTQDCIKVLEAFLGLNSSSSSVAIFTFRRNRFDSAFARKRGEIWRYLCIKMLRLPSYFDPASQLKILPIDISMNCKSHNFIWDIESTWRVYNFQASIFMVDVTLYDRTKGESSLSAIFFVSELVALRSLITLRRQLEV
jgi:glycosyltransferase involved in cell wall biosynthesis